jgi:hypothetical protein
LQPEPEAKLADPAARTERAQETEADRRRSLIEAALARARAKREQQQAG